MPAEIVYIYFLKNDFWLNDVLWQMEKLCLISRMGCRGVVLREDEKKMKISN